MGRTAVAGTLVEPELDWLEASNPRRRMGDKSAE